MVAVVTDVFVAGGGPAGLAAALAARRRGFSVIVADALVPPIDKACGEGLMPDAVGALSDLGIARESLGGMTLCGIRFLDANQTVEACFPGGAGAGVRRLHLHQVLVRQAEEAGVELLWQTPVRGLRGSEVLLDSITVRARWIVGADGQNSQIRKWAGLDSSRVLDRRLGLRQHFTLRPWSNLVEVHWGSHGQAYVTPINENEVGIALLLRRKPASFDSGLNDFFRLATRLRQARTCSEVRGAPTLTRRLHDVCRGSVALIGDAAGSVDAITGEGLGMAFRQATELADAIAANDLNIYAAAHRQILSRPSLMARALLMMDKNLRLRQRALTAMARRPELFAHLMAIHVGEFPLRLLGKGGALDSGWQLLTA